jgi:hypothetical protein
VKPPKDWKDEEYALQRTVVPKGVVVMLICFYENISREKEKVLRQIAEAKRLAEARYAGISMKKEPTAV